MKKQVFVTILAGVLAAGLAGTASAQAPAGPPPAAVKLAIFNFQRAVIESSEGKKVAEKLQGQFTVKRNELQAKQNEIERLQKQLRDQEKTLSDEARTNLLRQVESKTKEFTRSNEDFSTDIQQAEAQAFNEIGPKVWKVLDEYARKNGFHVVLESGSQQSPVLWANSAIEITDDIIKLYNAAPAPASAPAGGAAAAPPPAAKPPAASGAGAPAAKKPAATPPR